MMAQQASREIVPQPVVDIKAGSGLEGSRALFLPASYVEAKAMAADMAGSTAVPQHLRGKVGNCLAVLMQASRWGLDPFAVASKTYFINEQIAFEAQLVNAVVISSKILEGRLSINYTGEGNSLRCTVSGKIKGDPELKVKTQTIARITVRNSPLWKSDPEQQLGYYTTRAWARLHAPDVLLGVFTPDELADGAEEKRLMARGEPVDGRPKRSDFTEEASTASEESGGQGIEDAHFEPVEEGNNKPETGESAAQSGDESQAETTHDSQTSETTAPTTDKQQKSATNGQDARETQPMPSTEAGWEGWKRNILAKIEARENVEDLDRLQLAQGPVIAAAPERVRDVVANSFFDKRIDLQDAAGGA